MTSRFLDSGAMKGHMAWLGDCNVLYDKVSVRFFFFLLGLPGVRTYHIVNTYLEVCISFSRRKFQLSSRVGDIHVNNRS